MDQPPVLSALRPQLGFPGLPYTYVWRWFLGAVTGNAFDNLTVSRFELDVGDFVVLYEARRVLVRTITISGEGLSPLIVKYRVPCAAWAAWNMESLRRAHGIGENQWSVSVLWTFNDLLVGKLSLSFDRHPDVHVDALNCLADARERIVIERIRRSRQAAALSDKAAYLFASYAQPQDLTPRAYRRARPSAGPCGRAPQGLSLIHIS